MLIQLRRGVQRLELTLGPSRDAAELGHDSVTRICGVDGCRAGWVCASRERPGGEATLRVFKTLDELLAGEPPRVVAIDLPIGLTERGRRGCDAEARRLLGFPRCASVFPAPIRPLLRMLA